MIGAHWPALVGGLASSAAPIETRLERALAAAGAVAWEWDLGSGESSLAAGAPDLLSLKDDLGFAVVHPEDRGWLAVAVTCAARGDVAYDFTFRLQRPDGAVEWVRDRGQLERDAHGAPARLSGVAILITEQKQAELAFAASFDRAGGGERRVRAALESTTDSVFMLGPDWRFAYLNRRAEAQISGDRALIGQVIWDAFPEAVGGALWAAYQSCMAKRQPQETEQFYAPLGRIFHARAFPAEDGGITVFFRDVTEERAATARLSAAESLMRAVGEASPDLIFAKDASSRMLYANPATLRVVGQSAAAVIGRRDDEWHAEPAEVAGPLANDRTVLTRGETITVFEEFIDASRGERRTFQTIKAPLRDAAGAIIGLVGVARDVTAERRVEAELAESAARFRAAVAATRGIVWTNTADGEMQGEQPGWAALTGQTPEQYQGYGWSQAVHPDDFAATIAAWHQAVSSREPYEVEHRLRRADGAWRWFAARAIPVRDARGRLREWVGVHTDITAQREAALVLARGREELEALVAARTRDLAETQARLAQAEKLTALGQLAGGIAHDFNNVLQSVLSGAHLLKSRAHDPEMVRRLAGLIEEVTERGTSVTQRMLAFARQGELRPVPLAPEPLLRGTAELLGHTLGAGITIRIEAAANLPQLLADRGQLETVLVNLATNARDAMPQGGTIVFAACAEEVAAGGTPAGLAPLAGAALTPGRYIRLSVSDGGHGMAADVLARVTEPFFTTKPSGRGTGLGLAMAKGFAEQSAGALGIASAPGAGTVVALWFPVAGKASAPAQPTEEAEAPQAPPARILMVDDEPVLRALTAQALLGHGHTVQVVESGAAALAAIADGFTPDLLLSDFSMPGMDGVAVIEEAQRLRPGLKALLLTGYVSDEVAVAPERARFRLLRKPISAAELLREMDLLLRSG